MEIMVDGAALVLSDDLDVRSTSEVRDAIYDHLALHQGEAEVVIDMTGVTSIDLTALRLLAFASRQAVLDGQHLTLQGCGPSVRRMLCKSRLIRIVDIARTPAPEAATA